MREIGVTNTRPFEPKNFVPDRGGFGVGLPAILRGDGRFVFGGRDEYSKKILLNLAEEELITDETVLKAVAALA